MNCADAVKERRVEKERGQTGCTYHSATLVGVSRDFDANM
jgi:hypothetical protein